MHSNFSSLKSRLLKSIALALKKQSQYPLLKEILTKEQLKGNLHLLALGKAAYQMAAGALSLFDDESLKSITILTKYGFFPAQPKLPVKAKLLQAAHPVPNEDSFKNSQYIIDLLKSLPKDDTLIILLSGGTSSLFEVPLPGISMKELIKLNSLLLRCGLEIEEINKKRKENSAVKGGKAAAFFPKEQTKVFFLSDVPGDDPATIGSGPFYLADYYNHRLVGNNLLLLKSLASVLKKAFPKFSLRLASRYVNEETASFAHSLGRFAKKAERGIYLFGGECSLKVKGDGKGGRLSHLALCMAKEISGDKTILFCAHASDGNDNLKESSGALVDNRSWQKMGAILNPMDALARFDSYTALNTIDAVIPGRYTGCNVNDIYVLIVE